MKIKLAILEKDASYLGRFINVFSTKYAEKMEIYSFTDKDVALNALNESKDAIIGYIEYELFRTISYKPVIYLYPEKEMDVIVKVDLDGEFVCTYPAYNDSWEVSARPDGTLIEKNTGLEYSYLFWEGTSDVEYDMSKGFVVAGEDTTQFLQKTLSQMGLTPKEYNEFIVYWLPQMESNPYNLITFQQELYTEYAKLDIKPSPDSVLRVFMAYKPLKEFMEVEEPKITSFERKGFTVVEWGGTKVN